MFYKTVPQWALGKEGCMVRALPALTILYLPESAAVQLTADCGLAGVKRLQCTGNVVRFYYLIFNRLILVISICVT